MGFLLGVVSFEAVHMHAHQCFRPEKREQRCLAQLLTHLRHGVQGARQGPGGGDALRHGHRLHQLEQEVRQQVRGLRVLPG